MYPGSWIYRGFTGCNFDLWWKQNGGEVNDLHKNECLQVDYLCQDGFNSEILPNGFVMQHQILINVIIFVAYVLNLLLNTQRSHCRSQRAGKWSLILAHDRRPIYRAPTYIAVPLLGPHQPRYIGLTLYQVGVVSILEKIYKIFILFFQLASRQAGLRNSRSSVDILYSS